jgi:hypothetical protein
MQSHFQNSKYSCTAVYLGLSNLFYIADQTPANDYYVNVSNGIFIILNSIESKE